MDYKMGKKIWYSRPLSFLWSQYNFTSGETFFLKPENLDKQNVSLNEQAQVYSFGMNVPYENETKGYAFQLIYYGNRKRISLI